MDQEDCMTCITKKQLKLFSRSGAKDALLFIRLSLDKAVLYKLSSFEKYIQNPNTGL